MITAQTLEPATVAPVAIPGYTFMVTLRHPRTGDEQAVEINTLTDSFVPVLREIQWARDAQGLRGYEIFEVLDLNNPF